MTPEEYERTIRKFAQINHERNVEIRRLKKQLEIYRMAFQQLQRDYSDLLLIQCEAKRQPKERLQPVGVPGRDRRN